MRTIAEHLAVVLHAVRPTAAESVPVAASIGRVAAVDAIAAIDVPAFDNSGMDGFAVRFDDVALAAEDRPTRLVVVHDVPAGSGEDPRLDRGEAVRIMTGAIVPSDADAVVPFEHTAGGLHDSLGEIMVLRAPALRGAHVRRAGGDARAGDVVLAAGRRIGALQAAALAASGIAEVAVRRVPRVAVVATGSELAAPGEPLARGRIPDSNSLLMAGLVESTGAAAVVVAMVADDEEAFARVLAEADVDVVVTSGGVSAGAFEVVRDALSDRIDFVSVAMQPGKPQAFGTLADGRLVFGLPGNPVGVAVSFELFVRPALLAMQGADPAPTTARLTAAEGWVGRRDRAVVMPVAIDRTAAPWSVRPAAAGGSRSHLVASLAAADGYAVVEDGRDVAAGDSVDVMLLP